jgi:hypothetical protein
VILSHGGDVLRRRRRGLRAAAAAAVPCSQLAGVALGWRRLWAADIRADTRGGEPQVADVTTIDTPTFDNIYCDSFEPVTAVGRL